VISPTTRPGDFTDFSRRPYVHCACSHMCLPTLSRTGEVVYLPELLCNLVSLNLLPLALLSLSEIRVSQRIAFHNAIRYWHGALGKSESLASLLTDIVRFISAPRDAKILNSYFIVSSGHPPQRYLFLPSICMSLS